MKKPDGMPYDVERLFNPDDYSTRYDSKYSAVFHTRIVKTVVWTDVKP